MSVSCKILFLFVNILYGQIHQSTHQVQSQYYNTALAPPADKVSIRTGLDVLLDNEIELIIGKKKSTRFKKKISNFAAEMINYM